MSSTIDVASEGKIDHLIPPATASRPNRSEFLAAIPAGERSPLLCWSILILAFVTAIMANMLFRHASGVGLNLLIVASVFYGGWFLIACQRSVPLWRKLCVGAALVYAAAIGFRASELLTVVNALMLIGFTALACSPAAGPVVSSLGLTLLSLFQVGMNLLMGALLLGTELPLSEMKPKRETARIGWRIVTGLVIATPFLVVFGILFSQADSRFQSIFVTLFSEIFDTLFSNFWMTFWIFTIALGLLRSAFFSRTMTADHLPLRGQKIGFVESATVMVLLNVMFLAFVGTQIPYFFGGQSEVSDTPNLVWSMYARRGFFELAAVVALVVPTLMLFMNLTKISSGPQQKLLTALSFGLSALTGAIIVSAFQRMTLYTANYGLSELRIYVTTFIVLLALVLLVLNVLNMKGRPDWFLPATLCLGVLFSLGIQTVNVQAIVANDIIQRHLDGKDGDLQYLTRMSTDVVPAILRSELPEQVQLELRNVIFGRARLLDNQSVVRSGLNVLEYPVSAIRAVQSVSGKSS